MNSPQPRFYTSRDKAARRPDSFSLVELMVVLAIMAILGAIAVPMISSIMRAQTMNQSLAKLSGVLDVARAEAIDKNSYVWVAFSAPSVSNPNNGIWVATITAADGTEALVNNGTWVTTTNVPSGSLQMLTKLENLRGVQLVAAPSSSTAYSTLITASGNTTLLTTLQTNLSWTVTPVTKAEGFTTNLFTQAIEFTPGGEARGYGTAWYNHIQFGLQPAVGNSTNAALYNVGRSSGKITVYRR